MTKTFTCEEVASILTTLSQYELSWSAEEPERKYKAQALAEAAEAFLEGDKDEGDLNNRLGR